MKGLLERFGLSGHVSSHEPVVGKPYTADIEEVHVRYEARASARAYGKQWRDSHGSVRTDGVRPDPRDPQRALEYTAIFDAETYTARTIWKQFGLAHTFQIPRSAEEARAMMPAPPRPCPAVGGPAAVPPQPRSKLESLGERTIEGVLCFGSRWTDEPSGLVTEHWTCRDLVLGLINIQKDREGEIAFRLYNLRLTEPDPALFLISDNR